MIICHLFYLISTTLVEQIYTYFYTVQLCIVLHNLLVMLQRCTSCCTQPCKTNETTSGICIHTLLMYGAC